MRECNLEEDLYCHMSNGRSNFFLAKDDINQEIQLTIPFQMAIC